MKNIGDKQHIERDTAFAHAVAELLVALRDHALLCERYRRDETLMDCTRRLRVAALGSLGEAQR